MLTLDLPVEPCWLDLSRGARVETCPWRPPSWLRRPAPQRDGWP
jgi:hypothetical protein